MTQPDQLPAVFKDSAGREHRPRLDFVKLEIIRDAVALDFGDVEQAANTWARFLYHDTKALDAIYIALQPSTVDFSNDEWKRNKHTWLASMDGPLLELARQAFRDALINFCQPARRDLLSAGIDKVNEGYLRAIVTATEAVDNTTAEAIERAIAFGTPATTSPAS